MDIQTRVSSRRDRPEIRLPPIPEGQTDQQPKLRGALKSLIENEKNYTDSLKTLSDIIQKVCTSQSATHTNAAVETTQQKIEEILSLHQMFHIGFGDALRDWYGNGSVGNSLTVFTTKMVVDVYSEYINNFEVSMETIRAITNPRRSIRGSVHKNRHKLLGQLSCNIVKPVQRFPQLIMIIKDLLKYTPRDHHDREALQEALTGIENVAYQLNERKRHNDQFRYYTVIMDKIQPRAKARKDGCLVRNDNVDYLCENNTREFYIEQRKLLLMSDEVTAVEEIRKDSFSVSNIKYEYRWHQRLRNLQLTTSANILNRLTHLYANVSPGLGLDNGTGNYADLDDIVAEIEVIKHDITVLEQTKQDLSNLKRSYTIVDEIQDSIGDLQVETQHHMYNILKLLQAKYIFLYDVQRQRVFPFCAPNTKVKHDWCLDFIMARLARESVNKPCWYSRERTDRQPALLLKCARVMEDQPSYQIKCAVRIHVAFGKDSLTSEHLWICSSNSSGGFVSILPLHMDISRPVNIFPVTNCDLVCAERVPDVDKAGNHVECVWLSTADSGILMFAFYQDKPNAYMKPRHILKPGCTVVSMVNVDGHVICGCRSGHVLMYSNNRSIGTVSSEPRWVLSHRVDLGVGPVTSMVRLGEDIWAACGNMIFVLNKQNAQIQHKVAHQMNEPDLQVLHVVKSGVGLWASFLGRPNIVLFHSESRKVLQEISITQATTDFLTKYPQGETVPGSLEVTSLVVSLGLLWVGTNLGVVLTYPLPRLRDGVPRINQRPHVAVHGHNGPIRFLVPVRFDPVFEEAINNQPSSTKSLNRSTSVRDKGLEHNKYYDVSVLLNVTNDATDNTGATADENRSRDIADDSTRVKSVVSDKTDTTEEVVAVDKDLTNTGGNGESRKFSGLDKQKTVEVANIKDNKTRITGNTNESEISDRTDQTCTIPKERITILTDEADEILNNTHSLARESDIKEMRISDVDNTAEKMRGTDAQQPQNGAEASSATLTNTMNNDTNSNLEKSSDTVMDSPRGKSNEDNEKRRISSDNLTDCDVKEEKLDTLFGILMKTKQEESRDVVESTNQIQPYKTMPIKEVEKNVILVVSGGNGYIDLRKTQEDRHQTKDQNIDPSIILWMYKC